MLANTPPMGWNSWNTFGPNINEKLIMEIADAMVEKGYRDAGYEYVVVDDCWSLRERDEHGYLVADPEKFPHGMKYLGDYIHSKGLKFGMYSAAGIQTCAGYPGSYGHEYRDAEMFASWGIDFLKYDLCHFPGRADCRNAYLTMSMALRSTGREILYAGCSVGEHSPSKWMRSVGAHMYRSTGDIVDNFESFRSNGMSQLDKLESSAPGCFNDPDMLVIGMYGNGHVARGGCTDEEYRMHFALWCLMGVPLMMGGDIRNMSDFCHDLLTNRELLAINQDPDARPPYYEERARYAHIALPAMVKLLSNGDVIIGYFNFSDDKLAINLYFDDIGVPSCADLGFELTDIFTGEKQRRFDCYRPVLEPHTCRLFRGKVIKR